MNNIKLVVLVAASLVLTACGLKSDLYLPKKAPMPTQSIESVEGTAIEAPTPSGDVQHQ